MNEVWVLVWKSLTDHDDRKSGVLRAYSDEQRANEDMELLNSSGGDKFWELVRVPVYRSLHD